MARCEAPAEEVLARPGSAHTSTTVISARLSGGHPGYIDTRRPRARNAPKTHRTRPHHRRSQGTRQPPQPWPGRASGSPAATQRGGFSMENCDVMSCSQDGAREQHAMLTAVEIEHAESTLRRQFRPPDPAGQPPRACGQQECLLEWARNRQQAAGLAQRSGGVDRHQRAGGGVLRRLERRAPPVSAYGRRP